MRGKLLKAVAGAGLAAAVAAGVATAAGPTPGFTDGVWGPKGDVQYTASQKGKSTLVQAVRLRDATVLRSRTLRGAFGVPLVAYDGTAGGVTRDGKLLVLETAGTKGSTTFVVLGTKDLKTRQSFTLYGLWAYDALSPEGKTLYLVQVLSQVDQLRYLVRAYDLQQHRLVKGAIADKSEPNAMTGYPVSRVASADGTWAYTLYTRPGAQPFIHALNTRSRVAICLDLTWQGDPNNMGNVRLTLSDDEKQLVVRQVGTGKALLTVSAPA